MTDPRTLLADPNTTAEQLAALAASYPEFGPQIAAHPNAYPALRDWIAQYATPAPAAPQQPAQAPSTQPTQPYGQTTEHTASPYGETPQRPAAEQAAPAQAPYEQAPYEQAPQAFPQAPTQPYQQAPQAFPQAPTQPYQQAPTQAFPQAPTQPYAQAFPQPTQAFPQEPAEQYAPFGLPGAQPEKKKRTGLIVGIAAGTVAVLAGGTIGAFAIFGGAAGGGASSPTAALTSLVGSVTSADMLGSVLTIAPSEAKYFEPIAQELMQLKSTDDGPSYADIQQDLTEAITVTFADVKTEETPLATDVTRVTLTDWSLHADGDAEKVADLMMQLQEGQIREMGEQWGMSESDIDAQIESARQSIIDGSEFPYDYTAADFRAENGTDLSVVTVKEDGGWYVSLLLSATDIGYQQAQKSDPSSVGSLGTEIVAPSTFDSPEAAVDGFVEVIADGATIADLAATLPLPERRLLSIYGPAFEQTVGQVSDQVEISVSEFSGEVVDGVGRVQIDELTLPDAGFSIEGICMTYEGYSGTETSCLDEMPVLEKLGVRDIRLIAVQEDGGWLFGPLATVGDIGAIFAKNFVTYANEDRLDELFDMGF